MFKGTAVCLLAGILSSCLPFTSAAQSLYGAAASTLTASEQPPTAFELASTNNTHISDSLPDAPAPQPAPANASLGDRVLNAIEPGYDRPVGKYDIIVPRGFKATPLNGSDKIKFALTEEFNPISLFTAARSAGYEHLRDSDPHFGSDKAGFGERLGAAAFRQGVTRMVGDGFLAAWTHEDPRYYRIAEGSVWHRGLLSIEQVVLRRRDDGSNGISYSGIGGHIAGEVLPITFYPHDSAKASVAARSFGTSLAADAGLKIIREFLPDLFQAAGLIPKSPSH